MLGHRSEGRIDRRLEPQRLGDAGLQIVADDALRHAAEEGERLGLALDPVRQRLAEARHGEGAGRGAEHCDEDLRLQDTSARRIEDRHSMTGIVGLHDGAGFEAVAEGRAAPLLEGPEPLAEPGVAVAVRMRRPVFLPQQRQRHALALQLARDRRPVRLAEVARRASHPSEQDRLQSAIIIGLR